MSFILQLCSSLLIRHLSGYPELYLCGSHSRLISVQVRKLKVNAAGGCLYDVQLSDDQSHSKSNSSDTSADDDLLRKETSKLALKKVFDVVCSKLESRDYGFKYNCEKVTSNSNTVNPMWRARLTLNWPTNLTFEGTGRKKVDAERVAASFACQRLKESGIIDDKNRPILDQYLLTDNETETTDVTALSGQPKTKLNNIYQVVRKTLSTSHDMKYVTKRKGDHRFPKWETTLHLTWPEPKTYTGVACKKLDAERHAASVALQHMRDSGVLNAKDEPVVHSREELDKFRSSQRSVQVFKLSEDVLLKMENVVKEINSLGLSVGWQNTAHHVPDVLNDFDMLEEEDSRNLDFCDNNRSIGNDFKFGPRGGSGTVVDLFSCRPYHNPSEFQTDVRNHELYDRLRNVRQDPVREERRRELPIATKKREMLDLVRKNPVVVLVGGTGCGKTTQVPQFILEEFAESMEGSACNVVVTQPRRIGAISIARWVAEERGEQLGDVVGYRVRLDGVVPTQPGRILFCSSGDFLRRLLSNPRLVGVSHVVVDEVHERDILIDFILILLRELVHSGVNPRLRILIMSATLDHEKLARYFSNCPVCHVEGFLHPVKQFYREDLAGLVGVDRDAWMSKDPFAFDADAVVGLIRSLDRNRPVDGAILCFLPGWQEIRMVHGRLRRLFPNESTHWVLPVHSKLSHGEQSRIFDRPPSDVRKILLATNIAETSITVDDVAYVVDCGIHRELHYNANRGTVSLETRPITQSNVKQRSGRAGRTRPGECFHFFPREAVDEMAEFPTPEMQRAPLESVILDAKAYFPECKASDFLANALDPPSQRTVMQAVLELKDLDMLDVDEKLTPLGRLVLPFTAHPRLAKAVVYAAAFRCLDPVLTVAALLSNYRDIFLSGADGTSEAKKQFKKQFAVEDVKSDHLIAVNAYSQWHNEAFGGMEIQSPQEFCLLHGLNSDALHFTKGIKEQLKRQLNEALWMGRQSDAIPNRFSSKHALVKSVLAAAFTPHIVHVRRGSVRQSRIVRDAITYIKLNGSPVALVGDSINKMVPPLDAPWLTYFSSVHSEQRHREIIRETSTVPFAALLLFAGRNLATSKVLWLANVDILQNEGTDSDVVLSLDGRRIMQCQCSHRTACALISFRQSMHKLLRFLFANPTVLMPQQTEAGLTTSGTVGGNNPFAVAHSHMLDAVLDLLDQADKQPSQ